MKKILLISGSREFTDYATILKTLNALHGRFSFTHFYHGAARGVDTCGEIWAKIKKLMIKPFPYLKEKGRAGGVLRNQQMLEAVRGEFVVLAAFPLAESRGTRDMISRCLDVIPVWVYEVANNPPRVLFVKTLVPKDYCASLDEYPPVL